LKSLLSETLLQLSALFYSTSS